MSGPGEGQRRHERRRTKLADVAKLAGVSVSTASRALNGRGDLSQETRDLVRSAALQLDFSPSALARSLTTKQSFVVGFVVPDISSPFYASVLRSAQRTLEQTGYRLMLMNTERSVKAEVEALRTLVDYHVDGLLIATTGLDASQFDQAVGYECPSVFFDGIAEGAGTASVCVENELGIGILVDHLVGHGHRRIALLGGLQTESTGFERLRGFRAAMKRHSLPVGRGHVRLCDWTHESGRQETLALLGLGAPPTAIVCSSDDLVSGCIAACRETGAAIPADVAIVSFDDPRLGQLLEPPLTALQSKAAEMGEIAASLLVSALQGSLPADPHLRLPVSLVVRGSCGCGR